MFFFQACSAAIGNNDQHDQVELVRTVQTGSPTLEEGEKIEVDLQGPVEAEPEVEPLAEEEEVPLETEPAAVSAENVVLTEVHPGAVPSRPRDTPPTIVVIVNPKSGGNAAGEFMRLPRAGVTFTDDVKATVVSYDIADREKTGFKHLAREVESLSEKESAMCIVAGGDGTVMWTIEEIFKLGIDIKKVSIGTVPFGTGNDFANVTKWGVSGPPKNFLKESQGFAGLKDFVRSWLRAERRPYDIWEVSVKTRPGSTNFEFIENGKKVCTDSHIARHSIRSLPDGSQEMSKYVCNYFSMGLDARVGLGFDKLRKHNRILNKGVYAWEGAKKLLFKKKGVVGQIVDSMSELSTDLDEKLVGARDGHSSKIEEGNLVFSTTDPSAKLLGNPVNLIFLNIPSIAGGLDIWNWSTRRMGVSGSADLLNARQDFGDGRLECLSYRTGMGFHMEQLRSPMTVSGCGNRVYSGPGPLRLRFRDPSNVEYIKGTGHCKGRTYMQVDGEFFVVHRPEGVVLRHHTVITVLVNADPGGCGCRR